MVRIHNILKKQKNKNIPQFTPHFKGSPLSMAFVLCRRCKAKKPNSAKEKSPKSVYLMMFINSLYTGFWP